MGDERLYRRLLLTFRDREASFATRFRAACAMLDISVATRLAHDLKIVAGSLGAEAVHEAAAALELACSEGAGPVELEVALSAVSHQLEPVIAGLSLLS